MMMMTMMLIFYYCCHYYSPAIISHLFSSSYLTGGYRFSSISFTRDKQQQRQEKHENSFPILLFELVHVSLVFHRKYTFVSVKL